MADAPLAGLALAREPRRIVAWDEADHVVLLDGQGERLRETTALGKVAAGAISDDGSLIALLLAGPRLVLLDAELEPIADRPAPNDALGLAIDSHGRYVAASSKSAHTQLLTRHGRLAGEFDTLQAVAHLKFLADRPRILAASSYGLLVAFDLEPTGKEGELDCEETWRTQVLSSIGRLAATGDGGMILASCHTHGIHRFDSRGRNEGAYHLGGTAVHAVPDFAGRTIAVATSEGELAILNSAGNVRWKTGLPRGPIAVECDALGRFVIYGLPTGEIARLDLEGPTGAGTASRAGGAAASSRSVRSPAWTVPVAHTDEQAETAVLAVLDEPTRVGVITNRNRLVLYTASGGELGEAAEIAGVGRILRTAPGWIVAATDRQIAVHDARNNRSQRLDLSLVEVTHLAIRPDDYGLAIIQERDRIGRCTLAGRWVWKRELRGPVEEMAVGEGALTAITTEDGRLIVFNAAGEPAGEQAVAPPEPLALVAAPAGSPPEVAWLTLARQAQVLRGHRRDGSIAWESPVPWESWHLHGLETLVVVEAPDGRAMAFDGSGHARGQSRADSPPGVFFVGPSGEALRVVRQGMHLICSELSGRVRWRAVSEEPIGPLAAGRAGAAALLGRSLAWFPAQDPTPPAPGVVP
jgi:hypothetical protein